MIYPFVKMRGGGTWIKGSPKINSVVMTPKGPRRVVHGTIARDGTPIGTACCKVVVVANAVADLEMAAEKVVNDMASWRFGDCIGDAPHSNEAVQNAEAILAEHPRRRWA